jgi:hypothetical protein
MDDPSNDGAMLDHEVVRGAWVTVLDRQTAVVDL